MEAKEGEILPPETVARDEATVERGFWPKMRAVARRIPFAEDAVAAWYCTRDPGTPFYVRATLIGALAYFVLPIDAIPDVIAALGYTDDAAIMLAALRAVGANIKDAHREAARRWLSGDRAPPPEAQ